MVSGWIDFDQGVKEFLSNRTVYQLRTEAAATLAQVIEMNYLILGNISVILVSGMRDQSE